MDRLGIFDLHERVANIRLGRESASANQAGGIDRVCDGGIDVLDPRLRADNDDLGWADLWFAQRIACREGADDARSYVDQFRCAAVEFEANLRGYHLNDVNIM